MGDMHTFTPPDKDTYDRYVKNALMTLEHCEGHASNLSIVVQIAQAYATLAHAEAVWSTLMYAAHQRWDT